MGGGGCMILTAFCVQCPFFCVVRMDAALTLAVTVKRFTQRCCAVAY